MRISILVFTVFMFGVFGYAPDSIAARSERIAVVVNEDVITTSDVNDRLALIIASSGLPNNQDIRNKLLPQILGSLVDEQIRLQEARRLELDVSKAEINQGFATIAQQNKFSAEQFRGMLAKGGIPAVTMEDQIRAQIAWSKVVQFKLRPQVVISQGDIDNYLERLSENTGKLEHLLAEIFLPVEAADQESKTRQLAQKLVQEIRSGKAPFFKVAQQFSKAAGSSQGGDLGWISSGQLQEELDAVLPRMKQGEVSDPIRTASGFHILSVREQRNITAETLPSREDVMASLGLQRLERLQRQYLLDLKSVAFIENRLEQ